MSGNLKTFRIALMLLFAIIGGGMASAQTVSGNVKDTTGEPIIGATVQEKGGQGGAVTDLDGNFTLNLSASKQLIISYVGMKTKTVNASGKTSLNIVLEDDATSLNDVVVIGYGTVKKKDLTGSVTSMNQKQLENIPVSNVSEAMTGKMAGVNITTTEGSPDADVTIRVRHRTTHLFTSSMASPWQVSATSLQAKSRASTCSRMLLQQLSMVRVVPMVSSSSQPKKVRKERHRLASTDSLDGRRSASS